MVGVGAEETLLVLLNYSIGVMLVYCHLQGCQAGLVHRSIKYGVHRMAPSDDDSFRLSLALKLSQRVTISQAVHGLTRRQG